MGVQGVEIGDVECVENMATRASKLQLLLVGAFSHLLFDWACYWDPVPPTCINEACSCRVFVNIEAEFAQAG